MIKNSLTSIDAYILKSKCWMKLEGCRIKKVYSIDDERILFKIKGYENDILLVFDLKKGLYSVDPLQVKQTHVTLFISVLRKYLNNSVIEAFSQVNGDRIYLIVIRKGEIYYHLFLEWIREGNIVLTNSQNRIITAYRMREYRDRKILSDEKYIPPPQIGVDPLLSDIIFFSIPKKKQKISTFMLKTLNISPIFIEETLRRCGLDWNTKIGSNQEELIYNCISILVGLIQDSLLFKKYYRGRLNGRSIILPFKPKSYSFEIVNDECKKIKNFLYIGKPIQKKYDKKRKIIEESIEEFREKMQVLYNFAEHLKQNYSHYENILRKYNELREIKENFDKIILALRQIDERVCKIDFTKNIIYIKINNERLALYASKSLYENISNIYDLAKEYQRKIIRAEEVLKSEEDINKKEVLHIYYYPKKRWYENFRWFISSSGIVIVGGRDASQNETLVKKYLKEDDLFFHADIHGGPVVIVPNEGNIDQQTIFEASIFAAVYSKAWELGLYSIDVYWVYGKQVSKKPPSGEYLPKGAFMIYGKKNYIKNVLLELAIGIKLLEEDSKKYYRIYYGPRLSVKKRSDIMFILRPGKIKKEFILNKIGRYINNFLVENHKKDVKIIKLKEILSGCLPKGGYYLEGYYRVKNEI